MPSHSHSHSHSLDIASATARQTSPDHKRFQSLLGKIEKARARLVAWQQQLPLFAQVHEEQVAPVLKKLMSTRREFAFELEHVLNSQRWSKADAASLSQMICDTASTLIDAGDAGDDGEDELKALFNRHSEIDFDSADQDELDALKGMLETVTGVDLGKDAAGSADELFARAHEHMAKQATQHAAQAQAHAQAHAKQHKPKRQTAAQKRADEDAARISQTVREVYRKLASVLHPDRISEPVARAQATAQMQRANAAYEAGDLLALLELQLQIEQIDIAHASGITAVQVRHFNKVLAEQLRELEQELDGRQDAFCMSYGLLTEQRLDPTKLGLLMKDEMRELAAVQYQLDLTRRELRGGAHIVKRFLKAWRAQQRADALSDDFF